MYRKRRLAAKTHTHAAKLFAWSEITIELRKETCMRKRIYEIIEIPGEREPINTAYDVFMIVMIILSLIPLAFKDEPPMLEFIDKICVIVFIIDYILRWITADYKYNDHRPVSFVKYPFSFMAIIDLVSILPSLTPLNGGLKMLRIIRMIRALRVFRIFKALRYSKNIAIIGNVLKSSKDSLLAVFGLAVGYIVISALVLFNVEPETFDSFFDAVYWATISLTTVGYGDIYATSVVGKIITMISSVFGIAIVALPAGIITAGYTAEIKKSQAEDRQNKGSDNTDSK